MVVLVSTLSHFREVKKAHKLFSHKLSVPPFVPRIPGTNWACPRDKPGFAGLPLCKIRRKNRFVPGFHRVCPKDKPGEIPGTNPGPSQDQPDKKHYVYVPFFCLTFCCVSTVRGVTCLPLKRGARTPAHTLTIKGPKTLCWRRQIEKKKNRERQIAQNMPRGRNKRHFRAHWPFFGPQFGGGKNSQNQERL